MPFEIADFVASWSGDSPRIDFVILGEPKAQNGFRVRARGLLIPRIYDPLASEKRHLRQEMTRVLVEHGFDHTPVFPEGTRVKVLAHFCIRRNRKKDLDNMCKFLGDALEMALYADDDDINDMHVTKERSDIPSTTYTIMRDMRE
jgi:Holliday junction resolvase RusA-like endonuclease